MRTLNNRSGTFDLFFKDAHAKQQKQLSPKNLMESKMGDKALTYLSLRKMVWNSYLLLFVHLTEFQWKFHDFREQRKTRLTSASG